jgi:hypothetical protein
MSLFNMMQNQGTQLDGSLDGQLPTAPLRDGSTPPINNTFAKGQYLLNIPNGVNLDNATDNTNGN